MTQNFKVAATADCWLKMLKPFCGIYLTMFHLKLPNKMEDKNMPVLVYNFVCGTGGKESESDFLPILEQALLVPETKI